MKRPRFNDSGICLAEAMIALAAGAVVLSATIQALNHLERRLGTQQSTVARHQDLRIGMNIMETELRLAGAGAVLLGVETDPAVLKAGSQEIQFLANLDAMATVLTEPAFPGQRDVAVRDGSNWTKGKRIVICERESCAENRLARDGRRTSLSLTAPLDRAFPAGSTVLVLNAVRYYLGKDGRGKLVLMRQVDGGANPLIGDVASFRLRYLDKEGTPTWDVRCVTRIRMELTVGDDQRTFTSEVGLRAV